MIRAQASFLLGCLWQTQSRSAFSLFVFFFFFSVSVKVLPVTPREKDGLQL